MLKEIEPSIADAGGHSSTVGQSSHAPEPFDQPIEVADAERRLAGPGGHIATETQTEDAATPFASDGDGIAPATNAHRLPQGDPTLSDQTDAASKPLHGVSGPDVGPSSSATPASAADVTLSDPAKAPVIADHCPPDHGESPSCSEHQTGRALATLSDPAIQELPTGYVTQGRGDGQSSNGDQPGTAVAKKSRKANVPLKTVERQPSEGGGQGNYETLSARAPAKKTRRSKHVAKPEPDLTDGGDGQTSPESQSAEAVATIVDLWRQRQRLRSTVNGLGLTAQAAIRGALGGDKEAAQAEWARIQKGQGDPDLSMIVQPYLLMMEPGDKAAGALEKQLCKIVRKLPIAAWGAEVRGLGELSLAGIIGEASGHPGDYRTVSALWKRFGLAVIEGERQRRVASAEQALIHGYAPQRRAFAYVVSCNLMKSQGAEGPYRQVYDQRKAYELDRDIPKAQAHNRALRYMVKRLFRDLWAADRRLRRVATEPEAIAA